MSSTGTTTSRSRSLRVPASTSSDRAVAGDEAADLLERALRRREADPLTGLSSSASRRSRESARWAPRLVPATACTSSTITVSIARSVSRACEVSIRKSDSGVVIRMSGGRLQQLAPLLLRRVAGADADAELGPDAGERPAQVALDVVVERLQRRDVEEAQPPAGRRVEPVDRRRGTRRASCRSRSAPGSGRSRRSRSRANPACAGVGPANARSNQAPCPGLKGWSASTPSA